MVRKIALKRTVELRDREYLMEPETILFFAANPGNTSPLALDEEAREIEQKIGAARHGDKLQLQTKWATRPDDLLQYLNHFRPHIVHFSGHGTSSDEIILHDRNGGDQKAVSKEALRALFQTMKDDIQVVVLNACYSQAQAEAITEVIDCAVGMKQEITNNAAITFASSFYRALAFGRSVKDAFEQGRTALLLEGIQEGNIPDLLVRTGVNP